MQQGVALAAVLRECTASRTLLGRLLGRRRVAFSEAPDNLARRYTGGATLSFVHASRV